MSGRMLADTIRGHLPSRGVKTTWYTAQESESIHAALDALLAENERLLDALEQVANETIRSGDSILGIRTISRMHNIARAALDGTPIGGDSS